MPDAIHVEELLREGTNAKRLLQEFLFDRVNPCEPNFALILIRQDPHYVYDVLRLPEGPLRAFLLDESNVPDILRRLRAHKDLPVEIVCQLNDVQLGGTPLVTSLILSVHEGVLIRDVDNVLVYLLHPVLVVGDLWIVRGAQGLQTRAQSRHSLKAANEAHCTH